MRRLPINIYRWLAVAAGCILTTSTTHLSAEDWPQWRGINRDAIWNDSGVVAEFPDEGLTVKWSAPVRGGFAGPAVAEGRVFVLDYQETPGSRTMDGHERLVVFDEETGALLWQQEWPATYRNLQFKFATGPRAVPTVDGPKVYTLGAAGMLSCFDTETGDLVWRVDTVTDYDSTVPVQGTSQAPIVEGDLLIAAVGGEPDAKVVAFDKVTGDEVWRSLTIFQKLDIRHPLSFTLVVCDNSFFGMLQPSPHSIPKQERSTGIRTSPLAVGWLSQRRSEVADIWLSASFSMDQ